MRQRGLCAGFEGTEWLDRIGEIYRTLDLVLHSHTNPKEAKKLYGNIEAPEWLCLTISEDSLAADRNNTARKLLSDFNIDRELNAPKYCQEIMEHLEPSMIGPVAERITYLEFPCYYQRLKELRDYMDSRQPRGLRALWRDRRNTNAYYTFWLVTIFGGCGVFLGLFTLVVAIIQAWGQLQTIH